ncbi:low-density lipoprotein receptor-related protein-like [Ruditapes philippinarum]|uniref:low-density lipoprotein receptor-related protein-like n=1 Tax=Ruditapes philippinarum TaxID=129788 RepID=UPI00295B68F5|nr:low-density lipoprotein receptor-related protein-like [Ruditapes philippinarum]
MNYVQYLLRSKLYQQNKTEENEVAEKEKFLGAHIGLKRIKDKQRRTDFIWITTFNVTFSAWKNGQPSTGDCTMTSLNFNDRELWETQNCFSNIADFYICEKPFSLDRDKQKHNITEDVCKGVYMKKDLIASPHSGKSCQNWRMLSVKAKSDFNTYLYSSRYTLHDSMCKDPYAQDNLWCYVIDADEYMRDPCFLHQIDSDKSVINMTERKLPGVNCSDGSSIPTVNWCDRNFDCFDYTDELSCQTSTKDHNLTSIGSTMIQSNLPQRLQARAFFVCVKSQEWISMLAKCDGVIDCLDASDEVNCSNSSIACDDNTFSCDGGNCIKLSQVCDFIQDCTDGTDELCEYQVCDENEFCCENKRCISSEKRCNAKTDCSDKSDELDCDSCKESFLCADDYKCIPHRLTCDGYPDCRDRNDELSCYVTPPFSGDFKNKYISAGEQKLQFYNLDSIWKLTSIGYESGRITFSSNSIYLPENKFLDSGYSCFIKVKTDCRFKFREAALIDNVDSNDFAYPFCDCTIGTFKKYRDQVYRFDLVSVSRCDGSEITDLRAVKESIYSKINGVFDLYSLWTSAFLHRTYIPPYCTNEYNATVFGEFFNCEKDGKAISESLVCIYAEDDSGYMTGCRSGEHLQNCGSENIYKLSNVLFLTFIIVMSVSCY